MRTRGWKCGPALSIVQRLGGGLFFLSIATGAHAQLVSAPLKVGRMVCPAVSWASTLDAPPSGNAAAECCSLLRGLEGTRWASATQTQKDDAIAACNLGAAELAVEADAVNLQPQFCGLAGLPSDATPLRKGQTALSVQAALATFDRDEGVKLEPQDRVEGGFLWINATHGFSKKLDASLVVPVLSFDHPAVLDGFAAGAGPPSPDLGEGRDTGLGDILARARYRLKLVAPRYSGQPGSASGKRRGKALSVFAEVRGPSGDKGSLLGIPYWSGRLGLAGELQLPEAPGRQIDLSLSAWLYGRAGAYGFGFVSAVDAVFKEDSSIGIGATGISYNDPDDPTGHNAERYYDAFVRLRVRLDGRGKKRFRGTDAMFRVQKPINDRGFRPSTLLSAGIQHTF